jgi:hypothetical protein
VWLVDPPDAPGLDAAVEPAGRVAGVIVTVGRHRRDAAAIARRHGVGVWADRAAGRVRVDAPLTRGSGYVGGSPFSSIALWWPEPRLLVVGECIGAAPHYLLEGETIGLHPLRRATPPPQLRGLGAEVLLVGHGSGVGAAAQAVVDELVEDGPRRRSPLWRVRTLHRSARLRRAAARGSG